jgi:ferric-dicitrate binding protein FerR (iron transport regulator)
MSKHMDERRRRSAAREAAWWLTRLQSGVHETTESTRFAQWLSADVLHIQEFLEGSLIDTELSSIEYHGAPSTEELIKLVRESVPVDLPGNVLAFPRPESHGGTRDIEHPTRGGRLTNEVCSNAARARDTPVAGRSTLRATPGDATWARWLLCGASLCALLVEIGWANGLFARSQRFSAAIGERRTIALEDGTRIELNTRSEIVVRVTPKTRMVTLARGEALFDVGKDPRPFRIVVGPALFEDVGTKFALRRTESQIYLTVVDGRVRLFPSTPSRAAPQSQAPPLELGRHETIALAAKAFQVQESVRRLTSEELNRKLAWTRDVVEFHGEALSEAIVNVNRYTVRPLQIADPSIASFRIGGTFRATRAEEFVAALAPFGIVVGPAEPGLPTGANDPIRLIADPSRFTRGSTSQPGPRGNIASEDTEIPSARE